MSPARDIIITGNIASGKTTLAKLLGEQIGNSCYVPEPFEKNPFLPLYLQDKRRWGFISATHYFLDYVQVHHDTRLSQARDYYFVDAGAWTNVLLYGRYLYHEQIISPDEYQFYQTLCEVIQKAYPTPQPYAVVFVWASPRACWERMRQRAWSFQRGVELEYIEKLHHYLEEMKGIVAGQNMAVLELSSQEIDFRQPEGQQEVLVKVERLLGPRGL